MTEAGYIYAETKGKTGAPLVFTFHGTGGNEHQFHRFAGDLIPDAHVISPRGDVSEMGALRYFKRTGEGVYDMEDLARRQAAMAEFVGAHKARIGAERVIALGYSNGANIAAAVAMAHPDLFTDLALLHPLIPWTPEPQPGLARTRILISAGERDPICPAPATKALIDYFMDQGSDVTAAWHPGGHEIRESEVGALTALFAPSD
ncbi:Putative hydrolase MhqD [Roseivivax sp. THAF40]|uniref:alpha/beta hydrolase n=1 Tax=unclassified Roseivivax TaxID=2639302 RepID=UPI001268E09F|nr:MULTISPECIES: alpha/beta hydrolase [unclassified Roseivivax]QFS84254.1 Putative hydrolase MhqD [Roseivivax sp. THAF197b]QFT48082.1 Putative hydrolase MhqD [Roseivivax sp. THAF40]